MSNADDLDSTYGLEDAELEFSQIEPFLKLLPGWFTDRMMTDSWSFGLMMSNGMTIGIQDIQKVWQAADGSVWLDVTLLSGEYDGVWTAPTTRTTASINASHIVAAFELADT